MPKKLQQFLFMLSPEEKDEIWLWADGNDASSQIVDRVARPCGCWNVLYPAHTEDCTLLLDKEKKAHGHCA